MQAELIMDFKKKHGYTAENPAQNSSPHETSETTGTLQESISEKVKAIIKTLGDGMEEF